MTSAANRQAHGFQAFGSILEFQRNEWKARIEVTAHQSAPRVSPKGEKIMKLDAAYAELNVVQDYVPVGNSNRPGKQMRASSITIHNTDNTNRGANAAAHARYMKGADAQKRKVSWHYTVDDKFVYQSIPTNETTWHSGTKQGNETSVSIEICMNSDLDEAKAYDRAALLVAVVAKRLGIDVSSGVLQHHDWSGKNCPRVLREKRDGWKNFLAAVREQSNALEPVDVVELIFAADDHHAEVA
jgi:N-acetylmuramoyl-L-alanine amidase CwlA